MKNKKNMILTILFYVLLFLSGCIFMSTLWTMDTFGNIKTEEILYTLLSSLDGTDSSVVFSYVIQGVLIPIGICCIVGFLHFRFKNKITLKVKVIINACICLLLVFSVFYADRQFDIMNYVKNTNQKTEIYTQKKKHKVKKEIEYIGDETIIYQNPADVKITGEETNNLIYIYLESYENSFMDVENGGIKQVNCMPELTQLAKEYISFSHTDKLGGPVAFTGTTWTIGSMVGQCAGLPLKTEVATTMGDYTSFMPGAIMLGDVLAEKGYVQELMIGSTATFAGTDKMFKQHGNYTIIDYPVLKREGKTQRGDYCYWGINDRALFRNAKDQLTELANRGQKFNFTMATIDCHTTDGIRCSSCPNTYNNRYENIYACQSQQVNDFVEWCKQQPWYEKTTIILVGDHNTMAAQYTKDIPDDYERTTYNCFINSKVTTENTKNRQFSRMDMFPTTLAAMGFKVEGNKLALGTNLFSKLPTTIEKYGRGYIEQEVQKSSEYLDENIYKFNEQ